MLPGRRRYATHPFRQADREGQQSNVGLILNAKNSRARAQARRVFSGFEIASDQSASVPISYPVATSLSREREKEGL
jgi:hypothetical protein